jgi:hypothetical protein
MASTEKATQKAILDYLSYKHVFHYRNNTGSFQTPEGGFYRFGMLGSPDIVCVVKGRYIAIEVKDIKGVLNDNQKTFKELLEKAGGLYVVARSLDDVISIL